MPHTRQLDDRHSVTIRSDRRRSGGWESEGDIFVTATCKDIGVTVRGEGRTMSSAEQRAFAQARTWSLTRRSDPEDQG
jgi:hypothetical protein